MQIIYKYIFLSGTLLLLVACSPQVHNLQALPSTVPSTSASAFFLPSQKGLDYPSVQTSSNPSKSLPSPSIVQELKVHEIRLSPSEIVLNQAGEKIQVELSLFDQRGAKINPALVQVLWSTEQPELFKISNDGLLESKVNQGIGFIQVQELNSHLIAKARVIVKQNNGGGGASSGGYSVPSTGQAVSIGNSIQHCSENQSCNISVFSGNGQSGSGGDFGAASGAQFNFPHGIFSDSDLNAYIADSFNHKIRKISSGQFITTIAGVGVNGFNQEQGDATRILLDFPNSLIGDGQMLYFSDKVNNRVRKLDLNSGNLITFAGGGTGADGIAATESALSFPLGLALNSEQLFVADSLHHQIRAVNLNTQIISTLAGSGTLGFSGDNGPAINAQLDTPSDLALDAQGNLFVADTYNHKIRKINLQTGLISTVAGTGQAGYSGDGNLATEAQLNTPYGIAVSQLGHLYIADTQNKVIRMVNAQTGKISTIAGNGDGTGSSAVQAKFELPYDVFVDVQGNIYVVDSLLNKIFKIQ